MCVSSPSVSRPSRIKLPISSSDTFPDVLDALSLQLNQRAHPLLILPHPRTGMLRKSRYLSQMNASFTGIPSLFLPYAPQTSASNKATTAILEVQAVVPPNARSWFFGDEVVAGECAHTLAHHSILIFTFSRRKAPRHDPHRPRVVAHPNPPNCPTSMSITCSSYLT